jgi:hypothetical protein
VSAVNDTVRKALDYSFFGGIAGLYTAAFAKVAGGEPMDQAMKEYDVGLVLATKLHERILAETAKVLFDAETFKP